MDRMKCVDTLYLDNYQVLNDEIDSDDYPTRWGKATDVAEIVRLSDLPPSISSRILRYTCIFRILLLLLPHCSCALFFLISFHTAHASHPHLSLLLTCDLLIIFS